MLTPEREAELVTSFESPEVLNFLRSRGLELKPDQRLPIHGSGRHFYRVPAEAQIVMVCPQHAPQHPAAHLLGDTSPQAVTRAWLERRDFLSKHDLNVPDVYDADILAGCIVMQDLGDTTFAEEIKTARDPHALMSQAVQLLIRCQKVQTQSLPAYIEGLWAWELEHFWQWIVERYTEVSVTLRPLFDSFSRALLQDIASGPRGFCHRDFQSRNLMLHDHKLWLIDFQDLCHGPITYDWAALLFDSYVDWTDRNTAIEALLQSQREPVLKQLHAISLHRKLKDAGRHSFFVHARQMHEFNAFIKTSLTQAQTAFSIWQTGQTDCFEALEVAIGAALRSV